MGVNTQKALKLGQFVTAAYNPAKTVPLPYPLPFNYRPVSVISLALTVEEKRVQHIRLRF